MTHLVLIRTPLRPISSAFAATLLFLFAALLRSATTAHAGGGPENVFLVVNGKSAASMAVANHYVALRKIPARNLLYLDFDEPAETITSEVFRGKILGPTITAIGLRGLARQIDYIIYSSDFPTAVNFKAEGDRHKVKFPKPLTPPIASINGATYFWQKAMARDPRVIGLQTNQYMRDAAPQLGRSAPTRGFRSWYGWDKRGQLVDHGGEHYMLSMMLAVTRGRGTTVAEAIRYLERSATADGTKPRGTIYYVKNPKDKARSGPRDPNFAAAVTKLARLGVRAQLITGSLPGNKRDVMGAMVGTANFSWARSGSTILPGAICEHLTSFGGAMRAGAGQTPLTEFLRHGAAGASGTVVEPYAIQDKFPFPSIHVHYARGCTLAEAFYQSVFGPYQLLIVGDPLCRPWADIPTVRVAGIPTGPVKGRLRLRPTTVYPGGGRAGHYELFVDGLRDGRCKPGDELSLQTKRLADGYHELRVVAVAADLIQTQGRAIFPITVNNRGKTLTLRASTTKTAAFGQPLFITASSPGAKSIVLSHNGRVLGTIQGEEGRLSIDPRRLGEGPVRLRAAAFFGDSSGRVTARPLQLRIISGGRK